MERITQKQLQYLVDRINELTGNPMTPWTKTETGTKANIGNYHLSGAYGGYSLERMYTDGGGVTTPLNTGHIQKRELYGHLRAFIAGLESKAGE